MLLESELSQQKRVTRVPLKIVQDDHRLTINLVSSSNRASNELSLQTNQRIISSTAPRQTTRGNAPSSVHRAPVVDKKTMSGTASKPSSSTSSSTRFNIMNNLWSTLQGCHGGTNSASGRAVKQKNNAPPPPPTTTATKTESCPHMNNFRTHSESTSSQSNAKWRPHQQEQAAAASTCSMWRSLLGTGGRQDETRRKTTKATKPKRATNHLKAIIREASGGASRGDGGGGVDVRQWSSLIWPLVVLGELEKQKLCLMQQSTRHDNERRHATDEKANDNDDDEENDYYNETQSEQTTAAAAAATTPGSTSNYCSLSNILAALTRIQCVADTTTTATATATAMAATTKPAKNLMQPVNKQHHPRSSLQHHRNHHNHNHNHNGHYQRRRTVNIVSYKSHAKSIKTSTAMANDTTAILSPQPTTTATTTPSRQDDRALKCDTRKSLMLTRRKKKKHSNVGSSRMQAILRPVRTCVDASVNTDISMASHVLTTNANDKTIAVAAVAAVAAAAAAGTSSACVNQVELSPCNSFNHHHDGDGDGDKDEIYVTTAAATATKRNAWCGGEATTTDVTRATLDAAAADMPDTESESTAAESLNCAAEPIVESPPSSALQSSAPPLQHSASVSTSQAAAATMRTFVVPALEFERAGSDTLLFKKVFQNEAYLSEQKKKQQQQQQRYQPHARPRPRPTFEELIAAVDADLGLSDHSGDDSNDDNEDDMLFYMPTSSTTTSNDSPLPTRNRPINDDKQQQMPFAKLPVVDFAKARQQQQQQQQQPSSIVGRRGDSTVVHSVQKLINPLNRSLYENLSTMCGGGSAWNAERTRVAVAMASEDNYQDDYVHYKCCAKYPTTLDADSPPPQRYSSNSTTHSHTTSDSLSADEHTASRHAHVRPLPLPLPPQPRQQQQKQPFELNADPDANHFTSVYDIEKTLRRFRRPHSVLEIDFPSPTPPPPPAPRVHAVTANTKRPANGYVDTSNASWFVSTMQTTTAASPALSPRSSPVDEDAYDDYDVPTTRAHNHGAVTPPSRVNNYPYLIQYPCAVNPTPPSPTNRTTNTTMAMMMMSRNAATQPREHPFQQLLKKAVPTSQHHHQPHPHPQLHHARNHAFDLKPTRAF